ncbi:hypothetical protein NVP2096O_47 [Vibrio phage 2.096.O._10N.286.48.B5]|nr:hypothetical protein NVP2096O_47 [Vibrio phage 2.096.O._10N.286.48.B5]
MIDKTIKAILRSANTPTIMLNRQKTLQQLVDVHGLTNVALATELKESSLKQYLREKKPRISAGVIAQAEFVFNSVNYKKAVNALDNLS